MAGKSGWLDKNKGFLYTILAAAIFVGMAWGSTQWRVQALEHNVNEQEEIVKVECARSQKEDTRLRIQIVEMQSDIGYLKGNSQDVKAAVKDTNTKLDWLIQQQIKKARDD